MQLSRTNKIETKAKLHPLLLFLLCNILIRIWIFFPKNNLRWSHHWHTNTPPSFSFKCCSTTFSTFSSNDLKWVRFLITLSVFSFSDFKRKIFFRILIFFSMYAANYPSSRKVSEFIHGRGNSYCVGKTYSFYLNVSY